MPYNGSRRLTCIPGMNLGEDFSGIAQALTRCLETSACLLINVTRAL